MPILVSGQKKAFSLTQQGHRCKISLAAIISANSEVEIYPQ